MAKSRRGDRELLYSLPLHLKLRSFVVVVDGFGRVPLT